MDSLNRFDWSLGIRWFGAAAIGTLGAVWLAFLSMWSVGEYVQGLLGEIGAMIVVGTIFGALLALGPSLGTAWLLGRLGVRPERWIGLATAAGAVSGAFAFALMFSLGDPETMPEALVVAVLALALGLSCGWVQGRQLPAGSLTPATWMAITTAAYLLAFMVGLPLGSEGREWLSLGVIAGLLALITAAGAMRLSPARPEPAGS